MFNDSKKKGDILVRWKYNSDEWGNFARYQLEQKLPEYRADRKRFLRIWLTALVLLIVTVPFIYWIAKTDFSERIAYLSVGIILFIIIIPLLITSIIWLADRRKIRRFFSSTGDLTVRIKGVDVNEFWWGWEFSGNSWQFENVNRQTVKDSSGASIEILEFHLSNCFEGITEFKEEQIPIPKGKEAEAEMVIQQLIAEKERFAEKPQN